MPKKEKGTGGNGENGGIPNGLDLLSSVRSAMFIELIPLLSLEPQRGDIEEG